MTKKQKSIETTLEYLKDNLEDREWSVIRNRLATIADALETGQWTKEVAIRELRELSKG